LEVVSYGTALLFARESRLSHNEVVLDLLTHIHAPVLLLIGLAIFFGTMGARIFQWLRIPQVVGYIVIGLLVGRSGLKLLNQQTIASLQPFNFFALGVIGFMIGGELHRDVFKKYGKQFMVVLLSEGLGAFFVVGVTTALIALVATGDAKLAVALGMVLGAISSATAPAATVDVLWEYKSRGPLTTTVFAIVALDDGLALILYAVAASFAAGLVGQGGHSIWHSLAVSGYEIVGAVALGVVAGVLLNATLRWSREPDKALTFIIGTLAGILGVAIVAKVDLILAAMALGVTIGNLAPRRSRASFDIIERFAPPIYVLFFVVVGARLNVSGMPAWMAVLAVAYVIGRSAGKMGGAYLGARWSKTTDVVRKYLGLCLFSQAGVAIGLAILASIRFPAPMGDAIIIIVTTTTFLVQIIGPPSVKVAIQKAGEVGLNITEEDLIRQYRASDLMDPEAPTFKAGTPLAEILATIATTDATAYPVVDGEDKLLGMITLSDLKTLFSMEGLGGWLVAYDLMRSVPDLVTADTAAEEVMTRMKEQQLDYLVVVESLESQRCVGMVEGAAVSRRLSHEVIRRRRLAEEAA